MFFSGRAFTVATSERRNVLLLVAQFFVAGVFLVRCLAFSGRASFEDASNGRIDFSGRALSVAAPKRRNVFVVAHFFIQGRLRCSLSILLVGHFRWPPLNAGTLFFLVANFRWPPLNEGMFFWSGVFGGRT